MIWFVRQLKRDFPHWERSSQVALIMALALMLAAIAILFLAPQEIKLYALVGLGGLILVVQGIVLWANRGMVTPFTQAQRHYLAEEFEQAQVLLEALSAEAKADMRALTLLGNTYRQRGLLEESRRVLYEALNKSPNHHFPLYGFGRTLLSEGNYAEAADALRRALEAGAPSGVHVDLAEAYYRAGYTTEAQTELQKLDLEMLSPEPHRQLMVSYLLYRLNAGSPPEARLMRSGLSYWEANAARFKHTQYGTDLAQDIQHIRGRLE